MDREKIVIILASIAVVAIVILYLIKKQNLVKSITSPPTSSQPSQPPSQPPSSPTAINPTVTFTVNGQSVTLSNSNPTGSLQVNASQATIQIQLSDAEPNVGYLVIYYIYSTPSPPPISPLPSSPPPGVNSRYIYLLTNSQGNASYSFTIIMDGFQQVVYKFFVTGPGIGSCQDIYNCTGFQFTLTINNTT